jgi:hypothetical protein
MGYLYIFLVQNPLSQGTQFACQMVSKQELYLFYRRRNGLSYRINGEGLR